MASEEELSASDHREVPNDRVPLLLALAPVALLISLLVINVRLFGPDASTGANQIALLLAAAFAGAIGRLFGVTFNQLRQGMVRSIASALTAMLILLLIGGLTSTWMLSGVVPAMIYYGLKILTPEYFLVATVLICSIVSIATGSSWTTVGTVGIALLGIGRALGFSEGLVAGAIISGAYFGDKMSPLSDTTNLASAMAGTELFTHIRHMMWTTVPTYLLSLVAFWTLGTHSGAESNPADAMILAELIQTRFNLSLWLFLLPVAVVVMVIRRIDALIVLFCAVVLGGIVAILVQPQIIRDLAQSDAHYAKQSYVVISKVVTGGNAAPEDQPTLDYAIHLRTEQTAQVAQKYQLTEAEIETKVSSTEDLLQSKGMTGMLPTIWLILCAMCFGGAMETCGLLRRITQPLVKMAKGTASLIGVTAASCIFVNLTASDQYLSIVVPGRMFRKYYALRGLAPQNLSRTLEDSGTVTSVLIPWNTCGAAQSGYLGVSVLTFAPYCIFCWLSPIMTIFFGILGLAIARIGATISNDSDDATKEKAEPRASAP